MVVFRRLLMATVLLVVLLLGLWMLNQVLDSVAVLGRSFVDVPGYPASVDVWTYHDAAFTLLWVSYIALVVWDIAPWRAGPLTIIRLLIAVFGFAVLTAGLWISQDLMNAVLALHRQSVDLPFFVAKLDLYQARDLVMLLVSFSYIGFFVLSRVVRDDIVNPS